MLQLELVVHLNSKVFSAVLELGQSWNFYGAKAGFCFHAQWKFSHVKRTQPAKNKDGRRIRHYRFWIALAFMRIGFAKTWILYYYYSGKCGLISKNYHKYERQCMLLLPCAEQKLLWRQSDNLHVFRVHIICLGWKRKKKPTKSRHRATARLFDKTHRKIHRTSAFRYLHKASSFAQATGWTTSETAASLLNPTGCLRIQA